MLQLIWKIRVILGLLPSFLQIHWVIFCLCSLHFISFVTTQLQYVLRLDRANILQSECILKECFLTQCFDLYKWKDYFHCFMLLCSLKERYFSQSKLIFHIHATWILFLWFIFTPMKVTAKMHFFFGLVWICFHVGGCAIIKLAVPALNLYTLYVFGKPCCRQNCWGSLCVFSFFLSPLYCFCRETWNRHLKTMISALKCCRAPLQCKLRLTMNASQYGYLIYMLILLFL